MRSLDPLKSVTQRDADGLQQALTQGWKPQTILAKTGAQPDFSVWTETVMLDWAEGLALLDDFLPAITRRAEVMDAAVRNTSVGCVQLLWNRLGLEVEPAGGPDDLPGAPNPPDNEHGDGGADETEATEAEDETSAPVPAQTLGPGHITRVTEQMVHVWCRGLMTAMGELWTQEYEAKNVLPLILFFQSRGVVMDSYVYPGDFEPGDFRRAGHSLWTRAVLLKNWNLVNLLWPRSEAVWKAWPRRDEVLIHLVNVVAGDYRGLQTDGIGLVSDGGKEIDWEKELTGPSNDDKQHERTIEFDRAAIRVETEVLLRWLSEYGTAWVCADDLTERLVQPTPQRISAWLRLPSVLTSRQDRAVVWAIWEHVCAEDPNRVWLTDLTLWPDDSDVIELIRTAEEDSCSAFRNGWRAPMKDGGLTPAQRWEDMGGMPQLVAWMTPGDTPGD